MNEQKLIYVVIPATIQVPLIDGSGKPPLRTVIQPMGRQIAQACHVVSKLRHMDDFVSDAQQRSEFIPITTIILQARDSAEMAQAFMWLFRRRLNPEMFSDENPEYGPGKWPTAVAALATKKQAWDILGYLPLWGS